MAKRRGNNEGSIFQLPSGRWRAQVSVGGQRLSNSFATQREGRAWLRATRDQVEDGLMIDGARTALGNYCEYWLETAKPSLRLKTWLQYAQIVRQHIAPDLGQIKLKDLRPDQIQGLYTRKLETGTGVRTVRLIHAVLHRALGRALKWGLLRRNPCDAVDKPQQVRKEMKTWNVDQVRVFLETARGHRLEALFHLAIHTGLRQGELLGLWWSDLDWKTGELQVQRQLQRVSGEGFVFSEPKTASGRRSIALDAATLSKLREHCKRQKEKRLMVGGRWQEQELVFTSTVGTPLDQSNLIRQFKMILKKAGLPEIRFHDLRHTTASLLLELGIHPKVVQEILGHSSITVTMNTYSHVGPKLQKEAVARIALLVNPGA